MVGSLLAGKINPFQQERVKKKKSVRVCILDGDTSDLFLQINVVYSVIKIKNHAISRICFFPYQFTVKKYDWSSRLFYMVSVDKIVYMIWLRSDNKHPSPVFLCFVFIFFPGVLQNNHAINVQYCVLFTYIELVLVFFFPRNSACSACWWVVDVYH
jgi:hypothetical protein